MSIRELKKYNPATGKVPIVLFDGAAVYGSTVILRRFDHGHPSPALLSDDANIAAQQQMLEDWSDESLSWHMMAFRWHPKNEPRTIAQNSRFVPAPVRLFAKPLLRRLVGHLSQGAGNGPLTLRPVGRGVGESAR